MGFVNYILPAGSRARIFSNKGNFEGPLEKAVTDFMEKAFT